jgi:penicillin amidase
VKLCRTRHGPVQSRAGGTAYARRYAIWDREIETLQGLSSLTDARGVKDVDRAMLHVTWNENLMAADSGGNIGYWHPGLFQVRPTGWDERLPYPGTGEAEWHGLLPRRRDPHVINPRQGWLANWNNVPAVGRTTGDAESAERLDGTFHRVHLLQDVVARVAKRPTFARVKAVIRITGTTAQARPIARGRLLAARRGARSAKARAVLGGLLGWNGSYTRTAADGTVAPGVAMWESFKDQTERAALARLGDRRGRFATEPGTSHVFDTTYAEAYGLRTLSRRAYRTVAVRSFDALARRFGTRDPRRWREKRRFYAVQAQGAGSPPALPFFDRGTWEQFVALGR